MSPTLVYVDSSALIKLVFEEPESAALADFLRAWPSRVSSVLARIEVTRTVAQVEDPVADREAQRVLRGLNLLRLDDEIMTMAASMAPRSLRSLDAIHVASAQSLGQHLAGMVVYDRRLREAARSCGINTWTPR